LNNAALFKTHHTHQSPKDLGRGTQNPTLKTQHLKFYSYWFNDWASIIILANELGLKVDILTRVHLYDFEEEFSSRKYLPFRYTEITKVNRIASISEYAIKYLNYRFNIKNITLNRLGVNDNGLNPFKEAFLSYKIVSCSALSWYKRPLLLVELIKQFKLNIQWVHFGNGQMEKEFIEASKGLPENVNFEYKGRVSNSEIINFYKNHPIY
jgi:glycosyltransferase involved in cell wall biosynthesis